MGRKDNNIYVICESDGITEKILESVTKKKNFNSRLFKQNFELWKIETNEDNMLMMARSPDNYFDLAIVTSKYCYIFTLWKAKI